MSKIFTDAKSALTSRNLAVPAKLEEIEAQYPTIVSDYYLSLIDPQLGSSDPIYRQCIPNEAELADQSSSFDPLAEGEQMAVPRVIHRFRDRVVLLVNSCCAVRCRFCFRKRTWATQGEKVDNISSEELTNALKYLREHSEIREVLISGGDPLMLPFAKLKEVVLALDSLPNIEIIRVATRLPVVAPDMVKMETIEFLSTISGLWLATHFNHPKEITEKSSALLKTFVKNGIPVINQSVLLRGVNDDADVLEELFRKLVALRVKPHYLFHVDPVRGVRHFATGIDCGLDILRSFRSRLSSLAVPTFAIDLPEGGGKVALQPNYQNGDNPQFCDIHQERWIEYK